MRAEQLSVGQGLDSRAAPSPDRLYDPSTDSALAAVVSWVKAQPNLVATFAEAIRKAIDEVLDGPRTGRFLVTELEKTEKTYVGTKIEIVVRSALGLPRSGSLDTVIDGYEVDVKWSASQAWMIPTEAVGQVCLLVGTRRPGGSAFDVGVVRCAREYLNRGMNKDQKRSLSSFGKRHVQWVVAGGELPPNYLATLDPYVLRAVLAEDSGQARLRRLFALLPPGTPVPRDAVETLGQQRDPMRRLRSDNDDRLGGLKILSSHYRVNREALEYLGFPALPPDSFAAIPKQLLEDLPPDLRAHFVFEDGAAV